jgi:hypothetical protein
MNETAGWRAVDWMGAWMVAMLGGGAFAFRWLFIVPRETVGMCAAANAPGFCMPRGWVLHWQYLGAFGWVALALGLAAFFSGRRMFAPLAVGAGIVAVVNYDATLGIIGAALGVAAWGSVVAGRWGRG